MQDLSFTKHWVKAQPLVTSYVFAAVRNAHDAEDILQEVAAAAVADFAEYDAARPFLPWVLGIAKFRILQHYRNRSADKLVFDETTLAHLAAAQATLEDAVALRRHALNVCLQKITGAKRRALVLRYRDNVPVKSIAEQMDSTPNAVSLLLHKVRARLLACIEQRLAAAERAP